MENQKKVIAFKNVPKRVSLGNYILWYLFLQHLDCSTYVYWIVFPILAILTMIRLSQINDQIETDIFEDKE